MRLKGSSSAQLTAPGVATIWVVAVERELPSVQARLKLSVLAAGLKLSD